VQLLDFEVEHIKALEDRCNVHNSVRIAHQTHESMTRTKLACRHPPRFDLEEWVLRRGVDDMAATGLVLARDA
jgi:hypothetical protein